MQFKHRQRTWTVISPKKIYKLPTNTQKDAQYHQSLGICKAKLFNTMKYYRTPSRMVAIKTNTENNKHWWGRGETVNTCALLMRMQNDITIKENSMMLPQKNKNHKMIQTISLLDVYWKVFEAESQRDICTHTFTAALFQ